MAGLARELGISRSRVAQKLRALGIESRIERKGHQAPPPTAEAIEELRHLYEEAGSVSALARKLGKHNTTVRYHLQRHGIPLLHDGFKSPKSVTHSGAENNNWKGGAYYHSDGYVYEYVPNHPDAVKAKGYVLQHRLVMEQKLGRPLRPNEVVHHMNEVKDDNRPENLELHDRSTHMKHHKVDASRDKAGRFG